MTLNNERHDHARVKVVQFACMVLGESPESGPGFDAWEKIDQRQGAGALRKTKKTLKVIFIMIIFNFFYSKV